MAFPLAGSARLAVVPARPRPAAMRVAMTNARMLLSLLCEGGADRASPRWSGVWRPRAAVRESAVGRMFIRRSACREDRPVPRRQAPLVQAYAAESERRMADA